MPQVGASVWAQNPKSQSILPAGDSPTGSRGCGTPANLWGHPQIDSVDPIRPLALHTMGGSHLFCQPEEEGTGGHRAGASLQGLLSNPSPAPQPYNDKAAGRERYAKHFYSPTKNSPAEHPGREAGRTNSLVASRTTLKCSKGQSFLCLQTSPIPKSLGLPTSLSCSAKALHCGCKHPRVRTQPPSAADSVSLNREPNAKLMCEMYLHKKKHTLPQSNIRNLHAT